ncbi:hypothetical protein IAG41_10785 [Sphingomonas sp. JC676]|uniref:hypothetical protein n=1 Tax=Sphingomonas sp. JC676 TaxID=2768065 RepID=UPI001657F534|nr:hypothetical protein [Sphingomonas sp. JC676]MBC9032878.1 hypothetical protein [Sphingomonas sp. JC676]
MIQRRAAAARLALILLGAAPLPALADITARYAIGEGKQMLVVEIDDSGDSRVGVDGIFSVIRRGGVDYVALDMPDKRIVARLDDAIKVLKTRVSSDAKEPLFVTGGAEVQVAGYVATSWQFGPQGDEMLDVALSADLELVPVGELLRRLADSALLALEGTVIPASSQFGPRLHELLAKGTPVKIAPLIELQSLDHKEIDPHRFDLPGPVASAEALQKALGSDAPPGAPTTPEQPTP